jgi:hypothetical protein
MKAKYFSRSSSCRRSTIDTADLEQEMNAWLAAHPAIKVLEIKHSELGNVWSYAQLVVAIYYTEDLG